MNFEILRRNVFMVFFLNMITCGIYGIVWFITTTNRVADLCKSDERCNNGGLAFLFSILTCGIYGIYWVYVVSKKLETIRQENGLPSKDDSTLNLILAIFVSTLIPWLIMQSNMNGIADGMQGRGSVATKAIEEKKDEEF